MFDYSDWAVEVTEDVCTIVCVASGELLEFETLAEALEFIDTISAHQRGAGEDEAKKCG